MYFFAQKLARLKKCMYLCHAKGRITSSAEEQLANGPNARLIGVRIGPGLPGSFFANMDKHTYKQTKKQGHCETTATNDMIKATLHYRHGVTHTLHERDSEWTVWDIVRALEKCEIEKAILELDTDAIKNQ